MTFFPFSLTVLFSLSLSFSPTSPQAATAAFSLFLVAAVAASFVLFSSASGADAARVLSSSDAGAPLPLVGDAFELSNANTASSDQVSAEAFRGVGAKGGGGAGGDASAAAAAAVAEPLPEGSPNLNDTAPATTPATVAVSAAAAAAAETPTPTMTSAPSTTTTTPPATTVPPPPPSPSTPPLLPPLAVSSEGHLTAGGTPIELVGLNWFGFEAGQTFVDGTSWSGSGSALSHDAMAVLWRMKLLGFNAVRLPFSFMEFDKAPRDVKSKCDRVSAEEVARSVAPPGVELRAEAFSAVPPLVPSPAAAGGGSSSPSSNEGHGGSASLTLPVPVGTPVPPRAPGSGPWESKVDCNADVPSTSVRDRLLWLVKKCVAAGFYVMLDDHISYDTTILDDHEKWVKRWRELAADLAAEPSVAGAVMLVSDDDAFFFRVGMFYFFMIKKTHYENKNFFFFF